MLKMELKTAIQQKCIYQISINLLTQAGKMVSKNDIDEINNIIKMEQKNAANVQKVINP